MLNVEKASFHLISRLLLYVGRQRFPIVQAGPSSNLTSANFVQMQYGHLGSEPMHGVFPNMYVFNHIISNQHILRTPSRRPSGEQRRT